MSDRCVRNKQVKLKNHVSTVLKETDMEVQSCDITLDLKEGTRDDVLVKNLYLSCDPYMRIRMSGQDISHSPPFKAGQVNHLPSSFHICCNRWSLLRILCRVVGDNYTHLRFLKFKITL